jgi:hypothetical protein
VFENAFDEVKHEIGIDFSMREYVKQKTESLARIKNIYPRDILNETLSTSASLADLRFKEKIEKIDVDYAIKIVREKIKNLREKKQIKSN